MAGGGDLFERDLSDGLNSGERAVLAAWDAGGSLFSIMRATGFSERRVRHIIELYDDRPDPDAAPRLIAANRAMVAATERLMQRMRAGEARAAEPRATRRVTLNPMLGSAA